MKRFPDLLSQDEIDYESLRPVMGWLLAVAKWVAILGGSMTLIAAVL